MGCSPSKSSGLVAPNRPDIARCTDVTASGAPLTFEVAEEKVSDEIEDKNDRKDPEGDRNDDLLTDDAQEKQPEEQNKEDKDGSHSASSHDSGIDELEEEYSFVITEFSEPEKVNEIEANFKENESIDLLIVGKACTRKLSPKDKEKTEEINILNKLREEGFVPRPPSRAAGGLRFEIVPADIADPAAPGLRKLPPLSLQRALSKKKINLTKEDIEEKLEKAEERRKQIEEERLEKIASKGRTEAMTALEQQALEKKERHSLKMENKAKIRQEKLRELQTRLKNHRDHVETVRHRKELLESVPNLDAM